MNIDEIMSKLDEASKNLGSYLNQNPKAKGKGIREIKELKTDIDNTISAVDGYNGRIERYKNSIKNAEEAIAKQQKMIDDKPADDILTEEEHKRAIGFSKATIADSTTRMNAEIDERDEFVKVNWDSIESRIEAIKAKGAEQAAKRAQDEAAKADHDARVAEAQARIAEERAKKEQEKAKKEAEKAVDKEEKQEAKIAKKADREAKKVLKEAEKEAKENSKGESTKADKKWSPIAKIATAVAGVALVGCVITGVQSCESKKALERMAIEQQQKEEAEKEAERLRIEKEQAEKEARERAEREAKEKADREAQEKAQQEAQEQAEKEAEEANKEFVLTDVNDEDQVAYAAEDFYNSILTIVPDYASNDDALTVDEIKEMIKWINGGIVEKATPDSFKSYLNKFTLDLLGKENQCEVNAVFPAHKLFAEGSARKQAERIEAFRERILGYRLLARGIKFDFVNKYNEGLVAVDITSDFGVDEYMEQVGEDLTVIYGEKLQKEYEDWVRFQWDVMIGNGTNNTKSLHSTDTAGQAAYEAAYIISTNGMVPATDDMIVRHQVAGAEFDINVLDNFNDYNKANCVTTPVLPDGTIADFQTMWDKQSALNNNAVREAIYNKDNNIVRALSNN